MQFWSRREFLQFMGIQFAVAGSAGLFSGCSSTFHLENSRGKSKFKPLTPTSADALTLSEGFSYEVILRWQDPLAKDLKVGSHCDYIDWVQVPKTQGNEIIMIVNHEYFDQLLVSKTRGVRSKLQMQQEMKEVGVSLVHLKKSEGGWELVAGSKFNRRLDANTPIQFSGGHKILGAEKAIGTFANCAGGQTPNGKFLTCEENYDLFYGEVAHSKSGKRLKKANSSKYGWDQYFDRPPEHYGWVVEVDPFTGNARKLTQLGRFAHEAATVTTGPDGRWVVYSGDDKNDEHLYKFISSGPHLEEGVLYVAQLETGQWLPIDLDLSPVLQKHFRSKTDLLVRTREAAKILGATPLDRPEDIAIQPSSQNVIVALTNNKPKGNHHGSLLRLSEKEQDPCALEFEWSHLLVGGKESQFSCPDNLEFDAHGDLWMTTDISGSSMNSGPYKAFKNNGLFYIPMSGSHAGEAIQIASAPTGAELTGPKFSPDGKELFLSVQHPGEDSPSLDLLSSNWPDGEGHLPKSSVVSIRLPQV